MEDETTTSAADMQGGQTIQGVQVDDQGQAVSQPEPSDEPQAVPEPEQTPDEGEPAETPEPVEGDEPAPAADSSEQEQLEKFARNKGIELDSENARKAAAMAMNAEKLMHEKAKRTSELEKATTITQEQVDPSATPVERDNIRLRNVELQNEVMRWKMGNPEKLAHESEMVKILTDPNKRLLVQEGYLSLDDVYTMARGSADAAEMKSQGKREALQSLAQKQQAAAPRGNATNSAQLSSGSKLTPQNVDAAVARMTPEEYRRRLPEINRAMQGG